MIQRRFPGSGPLAAVTLAIATIALGGCGGRKELPPLSAIVDAPYIRPGSSWTYKVEDTAWNAPQTVTLTFMKDDVYKNAGVLAFATASETILYDRDLNFVAVAADGRIIREASPSLRSFDFPFYVGKEWRSVFTFQDNQKGLSWTPVEVFWRVKESLVPARERAEHELGHSEGTGLVRAAGQAAHQADPGADGGPLRGKGQGYLGAGAVHPEVGSEGRL